MGIDLWFWAFLFTYVLGGITYYCFVEEMILPKPREPLSRAVKLGFAVFWAPILIGAIIYVAVTGPWARS